MRKVLADGNWHSFIEIYLATEGFYSPLVAINHYRHRARPEWREKHMQRPLDQQILLGKQSAITVMLAGLVKRRELERSGRGRQARFRMRPAATQSLPGC